MNDRGITLLELLVAVAIGSVVLLGISSFYLATLQFNAQSNSQTFLQRQAAMIIEEMARQIRPATALTTNCNGANSLKVTKGGVTYCFYRTAGNQLCETVNGGACRDLAAGSPVTLTAPTFTPTVNVPGNTANITFQLQDNDQNSMTFNTSLSRRN